MKYITIGILNAFQEILMVYTDHSKADKEFELLYSAWKTWLRHSEYAPLLLYEMNDDDTKLILKLDNVVVVEIQDQNEITKQRRINHKLWDRRVHREADKILADEQRLGVGFKA
jgi:hypothetical protein